VGRRGHTGDPLDAIRRIARTCLQLLLIPQYAWLTNLFDAEEHLAVKVDTNRRRDNTAMTRLINPIRRGVPTASDEIAQLARPPWRRRHPGLL
ncbi:Transposase, partial [Mycobacterium terramassiliense]